MMSVNYPCTAGRQFCARRSILNGWERKDSGAAEETMARHIGEYVR
jgi:hypothetical protein